MSFENLNKCVIGCRRCPRLVYFREHAPARKAFQDQPYWRRPLPGFGDKKAWLLILGLAPAAQGANRTGRVFTGDESARFLMNALYAVQLTNQPHSDYYNDGLQLRGCYMTAAVKCVPPKNRPTQEEFYNCSEYLEKEIFLLKNLQAVLALGKLAFDSYQRFLKKQKVISRFASFGHGKKISFKGWPTLYGAYHPSPQNTYTGKLTTEMFVTLLKNIKKEASK